jgi:hypothetical protein
MGVATYRGSVMSKGLVSGGPKDITPLSQECHVNGGPAAARRLCDAVLFGCAVDQLAWFFGLSPTLPILVGGALIIAGGLTITFWRA